MKCRTEDYITKYLRQHEPTAHTLFQKSHAFYCLNKSVRCQTISIKSGRQHPEETVEIYNKCLLCTTRLKTVPTLPCEIRNPYSRS